MIPGYYSYWITAKDPRTNAIIWEGMLLGKQITDNGEKIALSLLQPVPNELTHALASVSTYVTEWEPVWEDITGPTKGLLADVTITDDDKDK